VKATVHNLTSKHLLLSEALVTRRDDGADGSLFSMRKKGKMERRLAEWRTLLAALFAKVGRDFCSPACELAKIERLKQ
jgi:hypothetical protein